MNQAEFFLQQLGNGLTLGSAYALVAIGLTLVFGVLRVVNLAHGEVFMVGGFAGLAFVGFGLVPALLAGALTAGLAGLAVERLALRPLPASVDPHIRMVATIGAAVVLQQIVARIFSARQRAFPTPAVLEGSFVWGPARVEYVSVFILALASVLMIGLSVIIRRTRFGLAMRAVAESPRTAAMMGMNGGMIVPAVFALSSALAGIAGVLVGMYFNNLSPFIGIPIGLKALAAVIFGGLGNVAGAVVASLVIGVAEVMTVSYLSASWRDAVAFGIIVVALLLRPNGLFGEKIVEKV